MESAVNEERYIAPDGLPDDRIVCRACRHMDRQGKCATFNAKTMPDLPRRCVHFVPISSVADRRTGAQRWPHIVEEIAEIRRLDEEFMRTRR